MLTVSPAIRTVSLNCSPVTVEPSPYARLNEFLRSVEVELDAGLYTACPEQLDLQVGPGKKRSLLPVSKSTKEWRRCLFCFRGEEYFTHQYIA